MWGRRKRQNEERESLPPGVLCVSERLKKILFFLLLLFLVFLRSVILPRSRALSLSIFHFFFLSFFLLHLLAERQAGRRDCEKIETNPLERLNEENNTRNTHTQKKERKKENNEYTDIKKMRERDSMRES